MERRVTLKDIAREANVSVGTVDRAIHDRGRINEEKRDLILQKIKDMNYKTNTIARTLRKNEAIRIALVIPDYNYFFQDIIAGAQKACSEMANYNIQLELVTQDTENDPILQMKDFSRALQKKPNGILVAPLHPLLCREVIDNAVEQGIPVMTVNLEAKSSKRLCYIGQDSYKTGMIIGRIFGKILRGQGRVAILSSITDLISLQDRAKGFLDVLRADFPGITVTEEYPYSDDIAIAYETSKALIRSDSELAGIFANSTRGTIGIGQALVELNKTDSIVAVCYDTQKEVLDLLDQNAVFATVTQNPYEQGHRAVRLMCEVLLDQTIPAHEYWYTRADVIISRDQLIVNESTQYEERRTNPPG